MTQVLANAIERFGRPEVDRLRFALDGAEAHAVEHELSVGQVYAGCVAALEEPGADVNPKLVAAVASVEQDAVSAVIDALAGIDPTAAGLPGALGAEIVFAILEAGDRLGEAEDGPDTVPEDWS